MENPVEGNNRRVEQDKRELLSAVLFGERKGLPADEISVTTNMLMGVLSYRPPAFARNNIQEIDQTIKAAQDVVDQQKVDGILDLTRQQGWKFWKQHDGAQTDLGGTDLGKLYQPLWKRYDQANVYQQIQPAERMRKKTEEFRRWVISCRVALVAAKAAQASIADDTDEGDVLEINKWVDMRTKWLSTIVAAEGVERTALAFGAPTTGNQTSLTTIISRISSWLKENNHPRLEGATEQLVTRINDVIRQSFSWLGQFPDIEWSIHSQLVKEAALPIIEAAKAWIDLPQYQKNLDQSFNASTALKRLSEALPALPKDEQSSFRREAALEIKSLWRAQLIKSAVQILTAFEQVANLDMDTPDTDRIEIIVANLATNFELSSQQRYEISQSIALLLARARNIRIFLTKARRQAKNNHDYLRNTIMGDLFNYVPQSNFEVKWNSPLALEIYPSTDQDYFAIAGHNRNGGGTFFLQKTPEKDPAQRITVPVIVIRPTSDESRISQIRLHERTHAAYATAYHQFVQREFPKRQNITDTTKDKLDEIVRLNALPRAKDEIIAFMIDGRDFKSIEGILTGDPLYDYLEKGRTGWGLLGAQFDNDVDWAKSKYIGLISQYIQVADRVDYFWAGLSRKEVATLLAVLPFDAWYHLLPSR